MSYAEAQYIIDETAGKVEEAAKNLDETATRIASGIPPQDMQAFSATIKDGGAKLKFLEPADTYIDGQRVCSVKGVKIVMKTDGYPTNENDGTLIINNTEIGKYSEDALIIDGLTNEQEYYIAAFPYSDSGHYNRAAGLRVYDDSYAIRNRARFTPKAYILYGYKKKKGDSSPATRITAIEQAAGMERACMDFAAGAFQWGDWGNAFFMPKPYMVRSDGTLDYELDHNDQTYKLDGTASDISNSAYDGNAMAVFPTVWQYKYEDSEYEYRYFCNIQFDENYTADMWTRADGTIEEWHALSMFEGTLVSSRMRSLAGLAPAVNATAASEITYAEKNGAGWTTEAWCEWDTIGALLVLMGLSTNAQATYGYGRGGASAVMATGTLKDKPMFYGYSEAQSTVNAVKVFYMENWWGNIWNRIQGCIAINKSIRIKMRKPYNLTGADFINTGLTLGGTSGGYINLTKTDNSYGTVPYNAAGSATTYECDGLWYNTNGGTYVALVGGYWGDAALCGFSCLYLNVAASYTVTSFGARLSYGQPAA